LHGFFAGKRIVHEHVVEGGDMTGLAEQQKGK
jgi:hypothetical protein